MSLLRKIGVLAGWMFLELAVLFLGVVAVNEVMLKPALGLLPLSEEIARSIRYALSIAVAFGLYVAAVRLIERKRCTELSPTGMGREAILGFGGGFLALSVILGILAVLGAYRILGMNPLAPMLPMMILIFLLALIEELAFRGILYRRVEAEFGTLAALLFSAAIFGVLHMTNDNANLVMMLSAALGGAFIGLFYTLTRRLWIPIFFHFAWNLAQLTWGTRVSGAEEFDTLVAAELAGPDWLTGGEAGPENSVITIVMLVAIIAVSWRAASKRGKLIPPRHVVRQDPICG